MSNLTIEAQRLTAVRERLATDLETLRKQLPTAKSNLDEVEAAKSAATEAAEDLMAVTLAEVIQCRHLGAKIRSFVLLGV